MLASGGGSAAGRRFTETPPRYHKSNSERASVILERVLVLQPLHENMRTALQKAAGVASRHAHQLHLERVVPTQRVLGDGALHPAGHVTRMYGAVGRAVAKCKRT